MQEVACVPSCSDAIVCLLFAYSHCYWIFRCSFCYQVCMLFYLVGMYRFRMHSHEWIFLVSLVNFWLRNGVCGIGLRSDFIYFITRLDFLIRYFNFQAILMHVRMFSIFYFILALFDIVVLKKNCCIDRLGLGIILYCSV